MANRVTNEDIIKINEIYAAVGTYAETARQTGFSASTVKKYINPHFKALQHKDIEHIEFNFMTPPTYPSAGQAWRDMMVLSEEEIEDIKELQKEIMI